MTDNVYFPISSCRTAKVNFSKSIKNLRCIIHQFSSCQYANQCWWITVFYIHHWFNIMYCWCLSSCFLGSVVVLRFLWNLYFHQCLSTIHQVFLPHRISCPLSLCFHASNARQNTSAKNLANFSECFSHILPWFKNVPQFLITIFILGIFVLRKVYVIECCHPTFFSKVHNERALSARCQD